jgi:parallel beta-helix repeat protein
LYAGATGAVTDNVMENNRECGLSVLEPAGRMEIVRNTVTGSGYQGIWIGEGDNVTLANNRVTGNGTVGQRYGGIGIGKGRPVLNGNVASDNIGSGIWWNNEAQPVIGRGNLSDGKDLVAP